MSDWVSLLREHTLGYRSGREAQGHLFTVVPGTQSRYWGKGRAHQLCLLWFWVLTIKYRKFMFSPGFRVIYNEVIQTSKYYMRDVTAIESAWLLELAPHFYQQGTVGVNRDYLSKPPLSCFFIFLSTDQFSTFKP